MNRRISVLTAAAFTLSFVTSCGQTGFESEEDIENLPNVAYIVIDSDFTGIVSSNPKYCLNEEAEEYRIQIEKRLNVDENWLVIANNGKLEVYYADSWNDKAHNADQDGKSTKFSLNELYEIRRETMGDDAEKSGDVPAVTTVAATKSETTKPVTTTAVKPTEPKKTSGIKELGKVKLKTGGDTFTVAAWDAADVPALIDAWKAADPGNAGNVDFVNMDCGGGNAAEKYDNLFKSGDAPDVYFAEADWALRFINDDTKTAALDDLGFTDANFKDQFEYTKEIGRATKGKNAGRMVGTSWQTAAGGFAYRTDLAEQYLGVQTPEEMQAKLEGWDNFVTSAAIVAEKSGGKVALADSLGGMWQVFSANRTQPWVVDERLIIDDSCKEFADIAKTLWNNGGVTHNSQWSDAWIPAGLDGACMGYFVPTWGFGERAFFGQASSESYGKWALCEGPDSYFWGGTWMVVNPGTDNAEEAQSFIYYSTCDAETMHDYAISKPEFVNNITAMKQIIDKKENPNDYVTKNLGGQNYFAVLYDNVLSMNLKGLITPYDAEIKSEFLNAVLEYCENTVSWEDVENFFG